MHIPACETRQLEILTFQQAMEHRDQSAEYDRNRWLYIPDFYSEYRYILGTVGKRPLITIGINPSTAAPDALDNTLKSVQRIALGNGFDSFIMFNVYAQRATNPDQMDREFNEPLHKENMNAFRWVLERSGDHHRKAPLPEAVPGGYDGAGPAVWCSLVSGGQALGEGASSPSAISEKGFRFGSL